jgi:hypothetical protein
LRLAFLYIHVCQVMWEDIRYFELNALNKNTSNENVTYMKNKKKSTHRAIIFYYNVHKFSFDVANERNTTKWNLVNIFLFGEKYSNISLHGYCQCSVSIVTLSCTISWMLFLLLKDANLGISVGMQQGVHELSYLLAKPVSLIAWIFHGVVNINHV